MSSQKYLLSDHSLSPQRKQVQISVRISKSWLFLQPLIDTYQSFLQRTTRGYTQYQVPSFNHFMSVTIIGTSVAKIHCDLNHSSFSIWHHRHRVQNLQASNSVKKLTKRYHMPGKADWSIDHFSIWSFQAGFVYTGSMPLSQWRISHIIMLCMRFIRIVLHGKRDCSTVWLQLILHTHTTICHGLSSALEGWCIQEYSDWPA